MRSILVVLFVVILCASCACVRLGGKSGEKPMTVAALSSTPTAYSSGAGYALGATLAYAFRILADADITVTVTSHDTLDVTTLALGSDYTVTGADSNSGGNVVLITPVAADDIVTLARVTPKTQTVDLAERGAISAEVLERYMDKNTMICQELSVSGAATAYVDAADGLRLLKVGGTMSGPIAMGTNKITGMGQPTAAQDAATKKYADDQDALKLSLAGGTMSGDINANANQITSLKAGTHNSSDACRMVDLHGHTHNLVDSVGIVPGADIAMGTYKITGLGDPTSAQDAATRAYVNTADDLRVSKTGSTMTGQLTMSGTAPIAMGTNKITGMGDPTAAQDAATRASVDRRNVSAYTAGTISTNNSTYTEAQHVHIEVVTGESVALLFNVNIDISSMGSGDDASLALQITCGGTEVVAIPAWFQITGADASHVTNQSFIYKHTPAAGGTLTYAVNLMQDGSGILTWVINKAGLIATVTL